MWLRSLVTSTILGGCYHPTPTAGAPCSPQGECPAPLVCVAGTCGGLLDAADRDSGGADSGGTGDAPALDAATSVTVLDLFGMVSYANNDGTASWSGPWTEVGDDGDPTLGEVFIEVHDQNPTANTPALKAKVTTVGPYVYREANLAGAVTATLTYRFHNEINAPGGLDVQVSPNGGGTWVTLKSYAVDDAFGTESIPIAAYAAANTRIRLIGTAVGGRHFRIDDVGIAFTR